MLSLLISKPPYSDPADPESAARCLHLTPAELRVKLRRAHPEIWIAEPDRKEVGRKASVLRQAGVPVLFTHREVVAKVPDALLVHGFQFGKEGVIWELSDRSFVTPYEAKLLAVLCEPKSDSALPPRSANKPKGFLSYQKAGGLKRLGLLGGVGEAVMTDVQAAEDRRSSKTRVAAPTGPAGSSHRLDLYFFLGGKPRRFAAVQGQTKFQGLGNRMAASYRQNLRLLIEELRSRQSGFRLDECLRNVDLPEPIVSGMAYRSLWKLIEPGLAGCDRGDLASRLVFLTYCTG